MNVSKVVTFTIFVEITKKNRFKFESLEMEFQKHPRGEAFLFEEACSIYKRIMAQNYKIHIICSRIF